MEPLSAVALVSSDSIPVLSTPNQAYQMSPRPHFLLTDPRFRDVSTLVVKVTHRCNLDCSYCYENIAKGDDMSLSTFKHLVYTALCSTRASKLTFLFHGGEPTLLSSGWFSEAVGYARELAKTLQKEVVFACQSNILSISDEKLELFSNLGIRLSVSIDGPSNLPKPMRGRVATALENYKRACRSGLQPGVLMTINHTNFAHFREICTWLEEELEVRNFKANVVSSVGRGIGLPDLESQQIFLAYYDILEHMIATQGQGVIEDNLELELRRFFASPDELLAFPSELCRTKKCGAGERVLGITPNGDLLPCGRFQWDDQDYFLGPLDQNAFHSSIEAFKDATERFHSLVPSSWSDCGVCEARDICSYGCQAFIVRSKSQLNVDCKPTKMRYAYYEQNRARLEPIATILKARGQRNRYKGSSESYKDVYNDKGPYNDTYNDEKGSYADTYSDVKYDDVAYSDVRGYDDYSDKYNDYKDADS